MVKVNEEFPERKLARLTIPNFGGHAYRTYHPSYLSRAKIMDKILSAIISDFRRGPT